MEGLTTYDSINLMSSNFNLDDKKNDNKKIYVKSSTNKITGCIFEIAIISNKIKQNKSWQLIKNKTIIEGENWKRNSNQKLNNGGWKWEKSKAKKNRST